MTHCFFIYTSKNSGGGEETQAPSAPSPATGLILSKNGGNEGKPLVEIDHTQYLIKTPITYRFQFDNFLIRDLFREDQQFRHTRE